MKQTKPTEQQQQDNQPDEAEAQQEQPQQEMVSIPVEEYRKLRLADEFVNSLYYEDGFCIIETLWDKDNKQKFILDKVCCIKKRMLNSLFAMSFNDDADEGDGTSLSIQRKLRPSYVG